MALTTCSVILFPWKLALRTYVGGLVYMSVTHCVILVGWIGGSGRGGFMTAGKEGDLFARKIDHWATN